MSTAPGASNTLDDTATMQSMRRRRLVGKISGKTSLLDATPVTTKAPGKLNGPDAAFESAGKVLEDAQAVLTPEALWNRTIRPRTFENMLTRVTAKASKVASLNNTDGPRLSEELYTFVANAEQQKFMFEMFRNSPQDAVLEPGLDTKAKKAFEGLEPNLQISIITCVGLGLTAGPVSHVVGAVSLMNSRNSTQDRRTHLCLWQLPADTPEAQQALLRTQKNIHYAFLDKVVRKMSPADFVAVMEKCSCFIEQPDNKTLESIDVDVVNGDHDLVTLRISLSSEFWGLVS